MKNRKEIAARLMALVALLLCVATAMSSCGIIIINDREDDVTVPADTTAPPATEVTGPIIDKSPTLDYIEQSGEYLAALDPYDFGGGEVIIKGIGAEKLGGVNASSAGTIISLNRGKRNTAVQDAANVTLTYSEVPGNTEDTDNEALFIDELKRAVKAGESYAEMVVVPQRLVGKLAIEGTLLDVTALNCNYAEQPYFDYNAMQTSGGGELYAIIGDATSDPDYLYGVYFNKTLIKNAGLESPYTLVDSGAWTFDKYLEYMSTVSSFEHGIEELALHCFTDSNYADVLYAGGGFNMLTSAYGAAPTVTVPTDSSTAFLDKIKELFGLKTQWTGDDPEAKFENGEMLFYMALLSRSNALSTASHDWGIVPVPKMDAEQKSYRTLADPDMPVIVIPKNVSNTEGVSYLVNAYFAASYKYLATAYAENQMSYFLRDSESINTVYTIANSAVYDGAYMYGPAYSNVSNATYTSLRNVANGKSSIRNYYDFYASKADSSLRSLAPKK